MSENQLENFIAMLLAEKGAALNTVEAYRRDLEQFCEYSGCKNWKEINKDDIRAFLHSLSRRGMTARTIARKLSAIKEFCKFLFTEGIIKVNPALNFDAPKPQKPLPKFLTSEDMYKLINEAWKSKKPVDQQVAVMIELMYACGLRVSELIGLKEGNINFGKEEVTVRGKGSKERIIPAAVTVLEKVRNYLPLREIFIKPGRKSIWLFPSKSSSSGHMTRDNFFKHLKRLAGAAGLKAVKISPHVLRHSFATNLVRHHADLRAVQKMLGHEDISTTEIYTHILSEELIETVRSLHPLSRQ